MAEEFKRFWLEIDFRKIIYGFLLGQHPSTKNLTINLNNN